jgi:uncharacterized protein (DUF302 family)
MDRSRMRLAVVLLGVLGLAGLGAASKFKAGNDYTKSVARPYDEVLTAVKAAAQTQGFRVSNVHDIAASLRKEGVERAPYATVEVCNSKIAAQMLNAEPLLGSLMPCRIAVFQKGKETVVSMIRPTRLMTLFPIKAGVEQDAAQVEHSMEAIIDTATR